MIKTGDSSFRTTLYNYDNMGNLVANVQQGDSEDIVTRYTYDKVGNVLTMTTGLPSVDASGGNITAYTYDTFGRLASVTDPMGYTETYDEYSYMDDVVSKIDKMGNNITYTYDCFGITGIETEGTKILNTYNGLGQLTQTQTLSENGLVENSTSYTYDPFGNIATVQQGECVQSYSYDDNMNVVSYEMKQGDTVTSSVTYAYNNMNRLTDENVNCKNINYTYNAVGNITKREVSGNSTENYTYNAAGLLVAKTGGGMSFSATYRLDGLKTGEIENTSTVKCFAYDSFGRLAQETETYNGTAVYENSYTYDSFGNRIGMTGLEGIYTYSYDGNNRLTERIKTVDGEQTEKVNRWYDKNGNTVSERTLTKTGNEDYGIGTFGDGTGVNMRIFEYDELNRLMRYIDSDTNASYTYYADNLRASKTVNGETTEFFWNGSNLAGEITGEDYTVYSYDPTGIAVSQKSGNDAIYYIKDTHGDVCSLRNPSGTKLTTYNFDAFGNRVSDISSYTNFGYTGEYTDPESGLVYLRNRYYDPETGRFITADTHWDVHNMIYGDKKHNKYKEDEQEECFKKIFKDTCNSVTLTVSDKTDNRYPGNEILGAEFIVDYNGEETEFPNNEAINQAGNIYVYGMNNPVKYSDQNGEIAIVDDAVVAFGVAVVAVAVGVGIEYYKAHTSGARGSTYDKHTKKRPGAPSKAKKKPGWKDKSNKKKNNKG